MADSKRRSAVRKPAAFIRSERKAAMGLPPEFPLFPHKSGRWAKQVRGKRHYFGKVSSDPKGDAALRLWLEQKDDLLAGRMPRANIDGLTVSELCDRFRQAKDQQRDAGEIVAVTHRDYVNTTDRLVAQFGKNRLVIDLASEDFEALRASIAKTRGPVALGNEIQRVRVVFKYAHDSGLIQQPMRYGPMFKRPSRKVLRLERAKQLPKMFEAADVRKLLDNASPKLKAMILLGINCGFGNNDCGALEFRHLDLDGGWIDFPRVKTGVPRRCPLWQETTAALQDVLAKRRKPKDQAHANRVFITAALGPFTKDNDGPVSKMFTKATKETGLQQQGRGFYSLRHTFRTIADESRDQPACDGIMGHSDESMAGRYRERIGDDRLRAVADHVRAWLFPEPAKKSTSSKPKRSSSKLAKSKGVTVKPTTKAARHEEAEGPLLRIVG